MPELVKIAPHKGHPSAPGLVLGAGLPEAPVWIEVSDESFCMGPLRGETALSCGVAGAVGVAWDAADKSIHVWEFVGLDVLDVTIQDRIRKVNAEYFLSTRILLDGEPALQFRDFKSVVE